jgi:sugar lactone lactonase YvrE
MKKLMCIALLFIAKLVNAQSGIITTIAGNGTNGYSGDGGQATAAELNGPWGLAFDVTGNLYFSDQGNNRIRKINSSGIITTIVGNGTGAYTGDGGPATAAQLNTPKGVCFDALGNLYIADAMNGSLRKINTAGIITTFAGGSNCTINIHYGASLPATVACLGEPDGLAFDAIGNLYITDWGYQAVYRVNTSDSTTLICGYSATGAGSYSGDGGQVSNALLNYPSGITTDATGNIYFADNGNNRVRMINTVGIINTVIGTGNTGETGIGGQATAAGIENPEGVKFDASGNLYVTDPVNVYKVNSSGIITVAAGDYSNSYSGDGGQATNAGVGSPTSIAFDAAGNLYIAEATYNRIRKVTFGSTASIKQITNSNELSIYPNPNNGSFVIESNSATKQTMQVYDVNGKLVLSQIISGKTSIDASTLNEGIYNISLQSNEGVINKRLVIVR